MNKDIQRLKRTAESQHFRVVRTGSGHYNFFAPDGTWVVNASCTPTDSRAIRSVTQRLVKAGLTLRKP